MALPASDHFTYADNNDLAAANASWTQMGSSALGVISNQAAIRSFIANFNVCLWNADTFPNDQLCQAKVSNFANDLAGVYVRGSLPLSLTAYILWSNAGQQRLDVVVNGSFTTLIAAFGSIADNDASKVDAVGTTITCYKNGTPTNSTTDATVASGSAGATIYGVDLASRLDDWVGDAAGGPPPEFPQAIAVRNRLRPRIFAPGRPR